MPGPIFYVIWRAFNVKKEVCNVHFQKRKILITYHFQQEVFLLTNWTRAVNCRVVLMTVAT